jgi:site-specific DNA recombinase
VQSELTNVERAARDDLIGLSFVGIARLSFEPDHNKVRPKVATRGTDYSNREEHERINRDFIESRGGVYLGTIHEPDTSAWKKKRVLLPDGTYGYRVIRPKFERILKNLKGGTVGDSSADVFPALPPDTPVHGMVFPKDDRLTRDHRHLQDTLEVVEHYDRPIIDAKGQLDLLTKSGRRMAHIKVEFLKEQSDATSERVADKHYANALRGIPTGGRRPFGWQKDKRTLKKSEAKLLRVAAKDVREGIGIHTIERKWHEAGVLSPLGNPMTRQVIRNMLLNPRIAGIRTYRQPGKSLHQHYLIGEDGKPIMGQWEPILTMKEWREVVAILTSPDRPYAGQNLGRLHYLLSSIIRCGECGGKLSGNSKGPRYFGYSCQNLGCGKVSGTGKTIDRLITSLIFEYFADRQVAVDKEVWDGDEELDDLENEKAGLLAQFNENADMGQYIWPKIRDVEKKITALDKERMAHVRKNAKPKMTNIEERWPSLELEQQRAIVAEVFEVIILHKATKGANRFDPARLQPIYRQG